MAVSAALRAFNGRFYVGEESTPGTPVTPTIFVNSAKVVSEPTTVYERPPSLGVANGFASAQYYAVRVEPNYSADFYVDTDGTGMLFYASLGTVADSGAGPYTHTYTPGDQEAFSIEHFPSPDDLSGASQTIAGCYLNTATWTASADNDFLVMQTTWLGMSAADFASPTSLTDSSDVTPWQFSGITTLTVNSVDLTGFVQSLSISLNNGLSRQYGAGSTGAIAVRDVGGRVASITLDMLVDSTTYDDIWDLHRNGTEVTVVVTFTAGSDTLKFTLSQCLAMQPSVPNAESQGMISISATLQARGSSGTNALAIELINSIASGKGNG